MGIETITFLGLSALLFEAGGYEAIMVPEVGANVVKLYHTETGVDVLRTPTEADAETFQTRPQIFGLPLLFPPNRIEDGTYTHEGTTYQYPITLPDQNNYHHGIIKSQPFTITDTHIGKDYVEIEASFFSNRFTDAIFKDFPHAFVCKMNFKLSAAGLEQTTTFINLSDKAMPLGVGFHTPINVPFVKGGDRKNYKIQMACDKRWELSDRSLPTGKLAELNDNEKLLTQKGMDPFATILDSAYTAKPMLVDGTPYLGAIVTDEANNLKVYYEVDSQFKHWTLWNNGANVDYICPEPQTWAINAPNLTLDPSITGFQTLAPGKTWSAKTKLYVK